MTAARPARRPPRDDDRRVHAALARRLAARPEVAHNYERSHALNMWFVLGTDTPEGITRTAQAIEAETGLDVMLFPKLEEYFIGFRVQA